MNTNLNPGSRPQDELDYLRKLETDGISIQWWFSRTDYQAGIRSGWAHVEYRYLDQAGVVDEPSLQSVRA